MTVKGSASGRRPPTARAMQSTTSLRLRLSRVVYECREPNDEAEGSRFREVLARWRWCVMFDVGDRNCGSQAEAVRGRFRAQKGPRGRRSDRRGTNFACGRLCRFPPARSA